MTVSVVGVAHTTSASAGALDCANPTGIVAGDYMVAIMSSGNANSVTPPSGWSQLGISETSGWQFYVYGKVVGSSEPTSSTWTFGNNISISIVGFHSSNTGSMSADSVSSVQPITSTTSVTAPSFSTGAGFTGGALVWLGSYDTAGGNVNTWVTPSGLTFIDDYKGVIRPDIGIFYTTVNPGSGTFSSYTGSWTGTAPYAAAMAVLLAEPAKKNTSGLFFGTNS